MKHILQTILEDSGMRVRSYSGRSMYGKECLGVTCGNAGHVFSAVLSVLSNCEDLSELASAFEDMRTDNMGYDTIVYFPKIAYSDEDEETYNEDEDSGDSDE